MTAQKIYLVRHGQTDYNLKGIVQGSGVDASLNETGRAQARAFFDAYRHVPFDRIYTSLLKRSQETMQPFVDSGIKVESMKALNEISWGSREGQAITPEEDAYYHWILNQWQQGNTSLPIEGGESPDEVAARQADFIRTFRSRPSDQNILVCMHGRAMRILLCQLLSYPLRSMDLFEHENLCLYLLQFNGNHFVVEMFNEASHVKNLRPSAPHSVTVPK